MVYTKCSDRHTDRQKVFRGADRRRVALQKSYQNCLYELIFLNVAKSHCCAKLFSLIISFQTLKIIIIFFWTIQFNNRVKLHVQDFHNLSIVKICLYYLWFIFQLIYFRHFLAVLWFWCIFVATVLKSISPFEENKLYTITLKIFVDKTRRRNSPAQYSQKYNIFWAT